MLNDHCDLWGSLPDSRVHLHLTDEEEESLETHPLFGKTVTTHLSFGKTEFSVITNTR